jgi:pyridoxal phosphate phosphatase PHOSPHO2
LKLTEADYVMPRKNFPVWDLISENPLLVKAEIHEWINGAELERVLLQIIERISTDEISSNSAQLLSADCKLQTISIAGHDAMPQALSVTQ